MAKTKGIENLDDETKSLKANLRTNHLLLIGIDKYSNDIPKLNNAVNDAKKFRNILFEKYDFSEDNTYELFDQAASSDAILNIFDKLSQKLTDQDNLLIYFSGHGIYHDTNQRGYWIPVDAELNSRGSYLNNQEVIDFIKNVKAHHVFSIIDSCFSEALYKSRNLTSNIKRVEKFPSRWALSAGRLELVSDGFPGGESPFAHSVINFLKNETKDVIWVNSLCQHVMENVSFSSDQTPRGEPLPLMKHQGGQFIFRKKGFTEPVEEDGIESKNDEPTKNIDNDSEKVVPPIIKEPETQPSTPQTTPANMEDWRNQIKQLIAVDMHQAMVAMNAAFNRAEPKYNDLILLRARHNSAKMDSQRGVVTLGQQNMMFNQIRYALIEMVDDMEEDDLKHFRIQRK